MPKVNSKVLQQDIEINRMIGHIKGEQPGPTLIFIGGIHGNEPAGVFALLQVFDNYHANPYPVKGNIYGISGNLWALERGDRFHENDLNRLWTKERLSQLRAGTLEVNNEDLAQLQEIYNIISDILNTETGPFYFLDLHTTSSKTIPFLTVNDSLLNRKFTSLYPVPIILGIEEYLDGPALSYINELGYVAFGFEGGQHDDAEAIENHVSFIHFTLGITGCASKNDVEFEKHQNTLLENTGRSHEIYEIYFRHEIMPDEEFEMRPGFVNFQTVKKGQEIAVSNGRVLKAKKNGRMFMPLYQKKGDDGFFAIRKIPRFYLWLSAWFRKVRLDGILPILPGISWASEKHDELIVNRKTARFITKGFFHLFGYRSKRIDKTHLMIKNREAASRYREYRDTIWF